jgi:hypothetical protein
MFTSTISLIIFSVKEKLAERKWRLLSFKTNIYKQNRNSNNKYFYYFLNKLQLINIKTLILMKKEKLYRKYIEKNKTFRPIETEKIY